MRRVALLAAFVMAASFAQAKGRSAPARGGSTDAKVECGVDAKFCSPWILNRNGVAVITQLDEPATYRVCVRIFTKGSVVISVDGREAYGALNPGGAGRNTCALVHGRDIQLFAVDRLNPVPSSGYFERIDPEPRFRAGELRYYVAPPAGKSRDVLLVAGDRRRLLRVCTGSDVGSPSVTDFGAGAWNLELDGSFVLQTPDVPAGFGFPAATCIDVNAAQARLLAFDQQPLLGVVLFEGKVEE